MLRKSEGGNVLFLILIAVALFAALSFALTSSTRNGNGNISKEKAQANAAALLQYATGVRSAVQRLKVSNACADDMLDFTNNIYLKKNEAHIDTPNSNAPTDGRCNIFGPNGGNIIPVIPPPDALDTTAISNIKPGHIGFRVAQLKGLGTDDTSGTASANDIYIQQKSMGRTTCLAINDLLNIQNPSGEPPLATITGIEYPYANTIESTGIIDTEPGKSAFCQYISPETYAFVFAVIER